MSRRMQPACAWGVVLSLLLSFNVPLRAEDGDVIPALPTTVKGVYTSGGFLEELLLRRVYERDPQLQRLLRRGTLTTTVLPFLNAVTIGSTGLSQNIMALQLLDVEQPRISHRKRVPTTGIVGQSVLFGSLVTLTALRLHFNHRIVVRKKFLQERVNSLLQRLEAGEDAQQIRQELNELVGNRASQEFIAFWQLLHSSSVSP